MEDNKGITDRLKIKLYADGANIEDMSRLASLSYIQGLTTNPTLMVQAGVEDYESFGQGSARLHQRQTHFIRSVFG